MRYVHLGRRSITTASALLLALLVIVPGSRADEGSADEASGVPGIVGTWFIDVPWDDAGSSLTGFITYDHSGTLTETVTNMFGGQPFAAIGPALSGTDRGIWRHVPGGFELLTFRILFDAPTGEAIRIARIRSFVGFDGDRDHMSGVYSIAIWLCPTPTTCPDPTSAAPDVPEFAPPLNTWTLSRVRFER